MLTLLRHPEHLDRLRATPGWSPRLVEELLRYEPPVHYRTRLAPSRDRDRRGEDPEGLARGAAPRGGQPRSRSLSRSGPLRSRSGEQQPISALAAACIIASGRRSPASRERWRWWRSPGGCSTRGWSRRSPPIAPAPHCAGLVTCRSRSTALSIRGLIPSRSDLRTMLFYEYGAPCAIGPQPSRSQVGFQTILSRHHDDPPGDA